jgi:hypothetical protein
MWCTICIHVHLRMFLYILYVLYWYIVSWYYGIRMLHVVIYSEFGLRPGVVADKLTYCVFSCYPGYTDWCNDVYYMYCYIMARVVCVQSYIRHKSLTFKGSWHCLFSHHILSFRLEMVFFKQRWKWMLLKNPERNTIILVIYMKNCHEKSWKGNTFSS